MKNQYFGDINDYRKYGLLRILSHKGAIKTSVCWMLTADDDRGHGARTEYLKDPEKWRKFDPELFDSLVQCLSDPGNRAIDWAETSDILPSAVFFSTLLTDNADDRQEYFQQFLSAAQGSELVFFDPDNGFEVKSTPYGRKDSCKYLYWRELSQTFSAGHSVLVYQHFRREKRDQFIEALAAKICEETGASEVISFQTSHVVFLLAPQPHHLLYLQERSEEAAQQWSSEIRIANQPPGRRVDGTFQTDGSALGLVSHSGFSAPDREIISTELAAHVQRIGRRMVGCQQYCEGIALDALTGILPRCLILKTENRGTSKGSAIVGINPGRSSSREREFYVTRGPTYQNTVKYWERAIRQRRYYRWLGKLVDGLGFHGPILWTELAKCESTPETSGLLPLQTFRTCVGMYLQEELEPIPHTWPLIAIGTEAYKALAYLFPKRAVLGVPHPTGSRGHFARLFDDSQRLLPGTKLQAATLRAEGSGRAAWLSIGSGL